MELIEKASRRLEVEMKEKVTYDGSGQNSRIWGTFCKALK